MAVPGGRRATKTPQRCPRGRNWCLLMFCGCLGCVMRQLRARLWIFVSVVFHGSATARMYTGCVLIHIHTQPHTLEIVFSRQATRGTGGVTPPFRTRKIHLPLYSVPNLKSLRLLLHYSTRHASGRVLDRFNAQARGIIEGEGC